MGKYFSHCWAAHSPRYYFSLSLYLCVHSNVTSGNFSTSALSFMAMHIYQCCTLAFLNKHYNSGFGLGLFFSGWFCFGWFKFFYFFSFLCSLTSQKHHTKQYRTLCTFTLLRCMLTIIMALKMSREKSHRTFVFTCTAGIYCSLFKNNPEEKWRSSYSHPN